MLGLSCLTVRRMCLCAGGVIGLEMGSVWRRLGTKVPHTPSHQDPHDPMSIDPWHLGQIENEYVSTVSFLNCPSHGVCVCV